LRGLKSFEDFCQKFSENFDDRPKPVVLCILDGWGLSPDRAANAPHLADTPPSTALATCPHATLVTHGPDVGLPTGQMGNSEVGHTNIGAGRVVAMDLGARSTWRSRTAASPATPRSCGSSPRLRATGGTAHLMGVVSDGGVHGHLSPSWPPPRIIAAAGVPVGSTRSPTGATWRPSAAPYMAALLARACPRARASPR
jgi:2,3-bisphosphoglycerate-independent phosphoglycerate mutase